MLTLLAIAAVIAGLTGAWSPCGFSMVETLAPHGYAGRRRVTLAACATFTVGALAGGLITFGGLALVGSAVGAGGAVAVGIGAVVALAAAVGEARGARIVPQVRRQVPEPWRRVLPVPLAAALYGVLLGLGFTTFILTFAVWALAALCVVLGDPLAGAVIGIGFGIGRALPVVALAPLADSDLGSRVHAAMAERPAILRALRALDAAALLACALALAAGPASAADLVARGATDPVAAGAAYVFHEPGGAGVLVRGDGTRQALAGRFPAIGGGLVAAIGEDRIAIARADTLAPVATVPAPGADAVAVSSTRIAWRAGRRLLTRPLTGGDPAVVARGDVGRPALDGDRLAYHRVTSDRSELIQRDLAAGTARTLRVARNALLLNPVVSGDALLYVSSSRSRQRLLLREGGRTRELLSTVPTARRDAGVEPGQGRHRHQGVVPRQPARPKPGRTDTLWTTALGDTTAFVTRLRATPGGGATATLLSVPR